MFKFKWLLKNSLIICLIMFSLTGCNILKSKKEVDRTILSTNDSSKLYSGQYYVWHDENQVNIENDINTDLSKFKNYDYKIFTPVYSRTIPHGSTVVGSSNRIFWLPAENDQYIPTFYSGDALIYFSTDTVPTEFKLERFYDLGYTLGFYGLKENINTSEHFYLENDDNVGILSASTANPIASLLKEDDSKVFIESVGEIRVTSENISRSGTVKGLLLNSNYNVVLYSGTKRYTLNAKADTRFFSSYEEIINIYSYDFIGNGIIRINLPDYLKTGYYNINGIGLFRFVNGNSYDNTTDFNSPIIIRDDNNNVISNPIEDAKIAAGEDDRKLNNVDNINSSGSITSIRKSIIVENNDKVSLKIKFSAPINSTTIPKVNINFYMSDISSIYNKGSIGTSTNPFTIIPTETEIKKGYIEREITNLTEGTWIFEINGIENYYTHSEEIIASPNNDNSQIGDFK